MDHVRENVRIDKGVKRGPRKTPAVKAPERALSVAKRPLHAVPAKERKKIAEQVLDRYIQGEQIAKMAPDYKVSDVTIYALLLREHEGQWKEIQTARALARLETAQDQLDTAADALSLARARERVRSAQWELERLLHRLYAQKQEVTHVAPVQINIGLDRSSGVEIEGVVQRDDEGDVPNK